MWRCSIGIARSFSAPAPRPNSKITLWFSALMLISPAFLRAHISLPSDSQVSSGRGFQFACSETTIQRFLETLAASAPMLTTSMMFTKRYLVFSHGKRARRKSPKSRLFPQVCKSRKDRAIRTFPQPRRRRVFGYIPNVSTVQPRLTFLNGLARSARFVSVLERPALVGGSGRWRQLVASTPPKRRRIILILFLRYRFLY